jgi:WD40 repeat protein
MTLNAQAQLCLDVLLKQDFLPVKALCAIVAEYANAFEGRRVRTLIGHSKGITSLSVQGDFLVSASHDDTLKVWDVQTGNLQRTFTTSSRPCCVAFLPSYQRKAPRALGWFFPEHVPSWEVVAASRRGVRVFDLWSDCERLIFRKASMHVLPLDSTHLALSDSNEVCILNHRSGLHVATLIGHTGNISGLSLLPGGILASGGDSTFYLWDVREPDKTCVLLRVFETHGTHFNGCFHFRMWTNTTAVLSSSFAVHIFDVASEKTLKRLEGSSRFTFLKDGTFVCGKSVRDELGEERFKLARPFHNCLELCALENGGLAVGEAVGTDILIYD